MYKKRTEEEEEEKEKERRVIEIGGHTFFVTVNYEGLYGIV